MAIELTKAQILANLLKIDFFDWKQMRQIIRGLATDIVQVETLIISGAVETDVTVLELDHTSVAIAATLDVSGIIGNFTVRAISEPGVAADHTLTVSGGTLDGTNTIATFADVNDSLTINFDGNGYGVVVSNIGAVVLS